MNELETGAARATAPTAEAVQRVRQRVLARVPNVVVSRFLLGKLGAPGLAAQTRVRSRLSARSPARRWHAWPALVALAAAALLAVVTRGTDPPAPPPPVVASLTLDGTSPSVRVLPGLDLSHEGTGSVAVNGRVVDIDWDRGRLHVEVDPGERLAVAVHTRDAVVRVVGTGFVVDRDVLGTHVDVLHGEVSLTCTGGTPRAVRAGASDTCWPASAAGLLGRAVKLEGWGDAVGALAAADRGLDRAEAGSPTHQELSALRARALAALGRRAEALRAIDTYLANPIQPRAAELTALAETLRRTP